MDRTVPTRGSDEIALYSRTYYSLLRSTAEVQIKSLVEAHTRMNSALHVGADEPHPDLAAFIYVILRLPACIATTRLVVMGQSSQVFAEHGYKDVETWQPVSAPGRRRLAFYNGRDTLAVFIASKSDIDDLIPSLTAYQIERTKLHEALRPPEVVELLRAHLKSAMPDAALAELSKLSHIPVDDLDRLRRIWGGELADQLLAIAANEPPEIGVRLLAGSLADYRRATRQWWNNISDALADVGFEERPIYFVSGNTHSLPNLLSGYALEIEDELVDFIHAAGSADLQTEYHDILERNVPSSRENFLYYALKKYEASRPEINRQRIAREQQAGVVRVPSRHVFEIEAQVIDLGQIQPDWIDPRLRYPGMERLAASNALILNLDFPLGMAAYLLLSEISRNVARFRGIFIMGKAATLNGRIGDVMISNVVHDEQSLNTYLFNNCLSAEDVAAYLTYGTVLDNQKAVSALGTFLQNDKYMEVFYREGYTVLEMETGPYLSSVYEMIRPQRYPANEIVSLYNAPFPIGIIHYASDTPYSKGKNLGTQNLSYFGMDPTYASAAAIMRHIVAEELGILQSQPTSGANS